MDKYQIWSLVSMDEMEQAIDLMLDFSRKDNKIFNEVLLLSNRYRRVTSDFSSGLISYLEYDIAYTKVISGFINQVSNFDKA